MRSSEPPAVQPYRYHENSDIVSGGGRFPEGSRAAPTTSLGLPATLKSYVAVETETIARALERYFKSGSGKAVAKKRLMSN
jgi:hypothetical protein